MWQWSVTSPLTAQKFVALARRLGAQLATLDKAILRGATNVALSLKVLVSYRTIQQSLAVSNGH